MKVQIHTSKSSAEAKHYFIGLRTLEEYYSAEGQEFAGYWGGKGAKKLGLTGRMTDEVFARLCENLHPTRDESLTPRTRADRRCGFDVTFNVPKSVSLLYARTKDERIMRAFRQSVLDTMLEMEQYAATRVRKGGQDFDRITGNLTWAEIIHLTARPEGGFPDPHLHIHCFVMNHTYDPVEKEFKALQMGKIKEKAAYMERAAMLRFKENLLALGLELEATQHAFEIAGFDREMVEQFSRRTRTIEEAARKYGVTDPEMKAKLAVMTRERKMKHVPLSELEEIWWKDLKPEQELVFRNAEALLNRSRAAEFSYQMAGSPGLEVIGKIPDAMKLELGGRGAKWIKNRIGFTHGKTRVSYNRATKPEPTPEFTAVPTDHERRAVALAAEHLLETECAITEHALFTEASHNWCIKKTTRESLWQAIREAPLLRKNHDGDVYVTTREIWDEEQRILDACRFGKQTLEPINEYWKLVDEELSVEQQKVARHVLLSRDAITAIVGDPGTGKTRVLQEIKRGVEASMRRLIVLAPWASTAHDILRKDGFVNADTIARLMVDPVMQEEAKGGVWLVDEAGLVSNPEMDQLIALARELGARIVLAGDPKQHEPVMRGQPFQLMLDHGGLEAAWLTEIRRQRGLYKKAVQMLLKKDHCAAIDLLDEMDCVHEMPRAERRMEIARQYLKAIEAGETCVILAPTHVERQDVTEGVRELLKQKGKLKPSRIFRPLKDLRWGHSEKSNPANYKIGMVVEINEPVNGFRLHEKLEVIGIRDDMIRVRALGRDHTRSRPLPLEHPNVFSVHQSVLEVNQPREILRNQFWSKAQKRDPHHYKPGLIVQFNRNVKGFARLEQVEVIGRSGDMVRVRAKGPLGKTIIKALPLNRPGSFSIHERDAIEICEGELIRITKNGKTQEGRKITNGSVLQVDYITHNGQIALTDGQRLERDFAHFEYGYTLTSHASQGKTVDRVILAVSPELSYGAINLRQLTVSATRGRKGVKIFTESIEELKETLSETRKRPMATEIFREQVVVEEKKHGVSRMLGRGFEGAILENAKLLEELREMKRKDGRFMRLTLTR